MEIVKKNMLSIISGVIALLAFVAWFWPIGGMFAEAQTALNTKTAEYGSINSIRVKSRHWPVNGYENDPPVPLKRFPNEQIIKEGENLKDAVHKQADSMLTVTVYGDPKLNIEGNVHATLLPNVFPDPHERRFNFQTAYLEMVEKTFKKDLQAVVPPNDDEIRARAEKLWKDEYEDKVVTISGVPRNRAQLEQEWHDAAVKLPEQMRTEAATKFKLYVDANAIPVSKALTLTPSQPLKNEDLWYAQNMVWVQRDVFDAIIRINSKAANVTESPVKQLIKFEMPDDPTQYIQAPSAAAAAGTPAAPTPESLSGKVYTRTPTGRVCNPLYDVIQFSMQINVDARQVPMIITELERGKLITIYQADAATVDAQAAVDDGYIYGPAPIITLTLKGEELFMRAWTIKMMPEGVKTTLGITAADVAAATPAPAAK
ncbi:MAG: hypothetical protein JWN24_1355 [Phycisphaerales bacterium]|jgi:hypothetical protein|nr:hypothetical protein [Phycisphaerales bacterium]